MQTFRNSEKKSKEYLPPSLPTPESAETALRTQQIIGYESGIPDVADPLAGSH